MMRGEAIMSRNRYPVAVHLFFATDGEVLMLRRHNTGWRDGEYSVPAGHVEAGETVTQAAVREAREEVGVALERAELDVVHVMHRAGDDGKGHKSADEERIDFFVAVRAWAGEPANVEPDKCDDLRWFPLDALPENAIPYVRHALACWRAGAGFSEFDWGR
jgi:8-oxo-dGTP pyrophosphatase MutT (NUDIX family)